MIIKEYYKPSSLDEAYKLVQDKNGVVIGGGAFLHLGRREIDAAVDISLLGLDYIKAGSGRIEIGSMTTLRDIETNNLLKQAFDGILSKTASVVMGVQIRNMATIGGCVCGKYGFSDILTSLLALDAHVKLYKNGIMSPESFMGNKLDGDILTAIVISNDEKRAAYRCLRNTSTDFSILNAAVSKTGNKYRICVGARPFAAELAKGASDFLCGADVNDESIIKAAEITSNELEFGSDIRGSGEYRKKLCKALVSRCILEVVQ